ncbi:EamA family transporter, partial [bacterium]|nr:EamA family transporter [bacterium]
MAEEPPVPAPLSARSKALLGVVLCVCVWGVNYPATKIAYRELSPLAYTGWRFLVAAALILGWAVRNGAPVLPPRGLRRYGLLLALAGIGIYQPIFAIGVERTSGFAAALLNSV